MIPRGSIDTSQYYKDIRKCLNCSAKERKEIIGQIKNSVDEYISQNPDCTMENITRHFGSAGDISHMYISLEDPGKISGKMKNSKMIKIVLIVVAIAILIVSLTLCGIMIWNNSTEVNRPVYDGNMTHYYGIDGYGDDSFILTETIEEKASISDTSSTTKIASKIFTYYDENKVAIFRVTVTGTFSYDGSTSSCTSVSYEKTIYDRSWSVSSETPRQYSNQALFTVKLQKKTLGVVTETINKTFMLTCDENGGLS